MKIKVRVEAVNKSQYSEALPETDQVTLKQIGEDVDALKMMNVQITGAEVGHFKVGDHYDLTLALESK